MKNKIEKELLRPAEVCSLLGIALSHLNKLSECDPNFPRKMIISPRFTAYRKSSIFKWLEQKERGEY
ncbi:helix-turn-helix transcriptional regulator [Hydrogenovibrio kuenenii]|uniref:helix-turn-helix transcriptional regulator n=1 Tax=Hydrogenovibrio kuenenii TaxID=63658 RepID=UPI000467714F